MTKWVCSVCGYVYEGEKAPEACPVCKAPGTTFEDLPDDWVCPICGLGKDVFVAED